MLSKIKKVHLVIISSILLLAMLLLGLLYFEISNRVPPTQGLSNNINYSGPSTGEVKSGDEAKKKIVENERNDTTTSPQNQTSVVITYLGQSEDNQTIEVNSYTPHYEDGTCTITFSKDDSKIVKEVEAFRDAQTTICSNPLLPRSELSSSGKWAVTVSFKSDNGILGSSNTQYIEVK